MKEKEREVLALILAGGRSSRTGRPKALLPFPGGTCLERVIDACRGGGVSAVRLVVGCRGGVIAASVAGRPVDIVWNDRWPEGQLSSLQAGLRSLPAGVKAILACTVDYPLVTASVPAGLVDAWRTERSGGKMFIPVCGGTRGRPYLFDASLVRGGDLEGVGVDDLGNELAFVDVHVVLVTTAIPPRPDLGGPGVIHAP